METSNLYSWRHVATAATITAAVVSFALCLTAEFKKSKKKDLRLDGKLCYLPGSSAFELGIAALIFFSIAQVIPTIFISRILCSREQRNVCKARNPTASCSLFFFSWISFGIAIILISVATSMSRRQAIGEGWLDGECYLVKDGVYVGSAILTLIAMGSTLASTFIAVRQTDLKKTQRIHAGVDNRQEDYTT